MRKFYVVVTLVFVLAIAAEWLMLSNPPSGVVRSMKFDNRSRSFKLRIEDSYGNQGVVTLPVEVWQSFVDTEPSQ